MGLVDQPQFDGTPALHVHTTFENFSLESMSVYKSLHHIGSSLPCRPVKRPGINIGALARVRPLDDTATTSWTFELHPEPT